MIPRNAIPNLMQEKFSTAFDNQIFVKIRVFEGERTGMVTEEAVFCFLQACLLNFYYCLGFTCLRLVSALGSIYNFFGFLFLV